MKLSEYQCKAHETSLEMVSSHNIEKLQSRHTRGVIMGSEDER